MHNHYSAIERGIQLLDRHFGDHSWKEKVPWGKVHMRSTVDCIIGHLFGTFEDGLAQLGISIEEACYYGFETESLDYYEVDREARQLTDEWLFVIFGEKPVSGHMIW